jgi:hypothetical protein
VASESGRCFESCREIRSGCPVVGKIGDHILNEHDQEFIVVTLETVAYSNLISVEVLLPLRTGFVELVVKPRVYSTGSALNSVYVEKS